MYNENWLDEENDAIGTLSRMLNDLVDRYNSNIRFKGESVVSLKDYEEIESVKLACRKLLKCDFSVDDDN